MKGVMRELFPAHLGAVDYPVAIIFYAGMLSAIAGAIQGMFT